MSINWPGEIKHCHHCGMWHSGQCPRIKSAEYYPDGTLKKVEYFDQTPPEPYDHTDVTQRTF